MEVLPFLSNLLSVTITRRHSVLHVRIRQNLTPNYPRPVNWYQRKHPICQILANRYELPGSCGQACRINRLHRQSDDYGSKMTVFRLCRLNNEFASIRLCINEHVGTETGDSVSRNPFASVMAWNRSRELANASTPAVVNSKKLRIELRHHIESLEANWNRRGPDGGPAAMLVVLTLVRDRSRQ